MTRLVALPVLGVILLTAQVVVFVSAPGGPLQNWEDLGFFVILFAGLWLYWALGSVIVMKADGHIIGWLFAGDAALVASVFASWAFALVLGSSEPPHPAQAWFWLLGELLFPIAIILLLPAVALTFPTGTLPGPRWRWPVGFVAVMIAIGTLAVALRPGTMGSGVTDNPLTPWLPTYSPDVAAILDALSAIGFLSIPIAALLGVGAILVRFRRSLGEQRQQLKWFLAAMAPAAVLLPISLSQMADDYPLVGLLSVATLSIVPLSVALAILRYRLYDIDRIISRSISYGLVTALLLAVFLLVNLGLQGLLSSVTSGNSLAVAGSTLLAAALFTPVRERIQKVVDRRFDRVRYDGERTAGAFSDRMRDAMDLPTLVDDLDRTVRQAMAPSRVDLWLR